MVCVPALPYKEVSIRHCTILGEDIGYVLWWNRSMTKVSHLPIFSCKTNIKSLISIYRRKEQDTGKWEVGSKFIL